MDRQGADGALGGRRGVRMSVRVLMGLVLIVGGGLGWYINAARVQRDAVREIERANGFVGYGWQYSGGTHNGRARPVWAPGWLFDRLGPDFFGTVVRVHLNGASDEDLGLLAPLNRVAVLSVMDSRISGEGLRTIAAMDRLEVLSLDDDMAFRDDDLKPLKRLPRLRELTIGGSRGPNRREAPAIGDAGMDYLAEIRSLRKVQFLAGNPTITDETMDRLRRSRPGLEIIR